MSNHPDDIRAQELVLEYYLQAQDAMNVKWTEKYKDGPVSEVLHPDYYDINVSANVLSYEIRSFTFPQSSSHTQHSQILTLSNEGGSISFKPMTLNSGALTIGAICDFLYVKKKISELKPHLKAPSLLSLIEDDELFKRLYRFRADRHSTVRGNKSLQPLIAAIGKDSLFISKGGERSLVVSQSSSEEHISISLLDSGDLTCKYEFEKSWRYLFGYHDHFINPDNEKYIWGYTNSGFRGVINFDAYFVLIRNEIFGHPVDCHHVVAALALLNSGKIDEVREIQNGKSTLVKEFNAVYEAL